MGSKKGEAKYEKGHNNLFDGKAVDEDLFYACLDLFLLNRMKLETASIIIGLSKPTLKKRWNAVLLQEEIPESWFATRLDEHERIRRQVLRKTDAIARNLRLGRTVRIRKIIRDKKPKITIDYLMGDKKREFNAKRKD